VCDTLELSRSAFYEWKRTPASAREDEDEMLMPQVRAIFHQHRRRYGTRRIVDELRDQGTRCGRRRVAKLMKFQGLKALQPKSFKPRGTESRHRLGYSPNLLLDEEETTGINQLWVGDITYVPLADRSFSYLATLMDRHSRRIVAWHLAEDMTEPLVLRALISAIGTRRPATNLIHHTDRGGQYAGHAYRRVLQRAGIRQSMSRADNCYDNAFMESCFGTIKTELEMVEYENHRRAEKEIAEYIAYYNTERKHSGLGYLTPAKFESSTGRSN
jgi:transposase InsO family protein